MTAADTAATVRLRYRRPADRRSRPQRWRDAVAELLELQADYQQWLDGLPEGLADTPTADALRAVCDPTCWAWRLTHHAVLGATEGCCLLTRLGGTPPKPLYSAPGAFTGHISAGRRLTIHDVP